MAQGPPFPKDPVELLTRKDHVREPKIYKAIYPVVFGGFALAASLVGTYQSGKPALSGMPRHVLITALGIAVGEFARNRREKYTAERDAILLHYVQLHPEDFPPYKRTKFADVLEEWIPIR